MSIRPCPTCGSPLADNARFCGQCGTTIAASNAPPTAAPASPPRLYAPDVHEEVTVAREKPDLAAMKTIMDASPYGSSPPPAAGAPPPAAGAPPGGTPTPLVPSPETAAAPVVVQPAAAVPNVAKTLLLSKTVNDPDAQLRAREMVEAALGQAATAQAPPAAPKANLQKTMMMGGEPNPAVAAAIAAASAASAASAAPAAPAASATSGSSPPPSVEARGADASPLSKSVLAPSSWTPPPLGPAPAPSPGLGNTGGIDASRVVSVGPSADAPAQAAPAPQAAQAAAAPAPAPQQRSGAGAPALRTMLGMPASDLNLPPAPVPPAPGGLGATMPLSAAPANVQKTMLGVAIPGIAPIAPGADGSHGAHSSQGQPGPHGGAPPSGQPVNLASKQSTMLGVAIPGIAPTHDPAGAPPAQQAPQSSQRQYPPVHVPSQVQNTALGMMAAPEVKIVPRPKTLIDEPLPMAPQLPQKKGISALLVVGIVIAIVALAGGGIAVYALRSGGSLTAVPQLDENGRESLKIGCTTCPDGTTVALGASTASVTGGAAVLPLPAPLSIGENDLTVKIDRPANGRDEDVKVHVPVAYRVRADLSTLSAKPPAITVRVEATAGSTVSVDGKPLALDANGKGSYGIELAKETEGPGEAKTFERKIPFLITPKGGKEETGQLTARTSIVPLALDAPGRELTTDKTSAAVAGQTRPGTIVTIDGQGVPVDAGGRFGVRVELSAVGDKPLEIVASSPPLAPRIAKVKVTRVASLADAAKAEDAQSPIGFDVFGADPASKAGSKAVVEGEVVEARSAAGHTVLLIEDKKKCAKGASCLVRVVHGDEDNVKRGDTVRAYARVLGSVTASGKTVPDLEAVLVLSIKVAR